MKSHFKNSTIFLIIINVVLIIVFVAVVFLNYDFGKNNDTKVGITFSKSYAQQLNLNWQEAYLAMLDDLQVKNIRLVAQWNEVEPNFLEYDFQDLDWQITEAKKRNVNIILTIGRRTPRWPECHDPAWLANLDKTQIEQEQLRLIEDLVLHFKDYDNLIMWQVENEPFLDMFGECPVLPINLVKQEVAIVQTLDSRPILITDSGELSSWLKTSKMADKFGHTLYRVVYNDYLGYLQYYLPPSFYHVKAMIAGLKSENVIVAELQAEPWVAHGYTLQMDSDKMLEQMNFEKIQDNFTFAKKTGASEIYFWGAEWWYWLKINENNDSVWLAVKKIVASASY